jgi:arylsulfatase A-like enzyme
MKLVTVLSLALAVLCGGCTNRVGTARIAFLIVVDTLRPDRLSCYGYEGHATPNIDRLAGDGVLFTRAQAPASWTVPSMGSMLTGRYPSQLGLVELPLAQPNFRHWRQRRRQMRYTPAPSEIMVAEVLKDAGFRTTAFVNQPFLNHDLGFTQGFEAWGYPTSDSTFTWHDLSQPMPRTPGVELSGVDGVVVDAFVEWIKNVEDGKLFTWIHLLRPHSPYLPPAEFMEGYPEDGITARKYDGEIRATDTDVGKILDAIDNRFGLPNCLVIFASDHGEALGERGRMEHGHTLHTEVSSVPLIIAGPGIPEGATVDCRVATLDVAPTILDLLSVKNGLRSPGESLVRGMKGDCSNRVTYCEGMLYGYSERSLTRNDQRIFFDGEIAAYELFDLSTDPEELTDLSQKLPDQTDVMVRELEVFRGSLLNDLADALPDTAAMDKDDQRVLRSLRALGYIK